MASEQLLNIISKFKAIRIVKKIGGDPHLFNHKVNLKKLKDLKDKVLVKLILNTRNDDEN